MSEASVGILSRAPKSLRSVKIVLYDLPEIAAVCDRQVLGLNASDGAITQSRSPLMNEINLHIMLSQNLGSRLRSWQRLTIQAVAANTLPRLKSSGLLKVTVSAKPSV